MKISLPLALLAAAVLFSGAACAASEPPVQGSPAPSFQVTDLNGRLLDSAALKGTVVVVNFWATWCPPCREEIPDFVSVYNADKAKGLEIIGLSVDDMPPARVKEFADTHKITYPVAMATKDLVRDFDPGQYIPTTFIIDKKGMVRHKQVGAMSKADLEDWVNRLRRE